MRAKGILLVVVALASVQNVFSQIDPDSSQLAAQVTLYSRYDSLMAVTWNDRKGTADIITLGEPRAFADDPVTSATIFLYEIQPLVKKRGMDDELRLIQTRQRRGIGYIRFKQYYREVPVSEGEYVITLFGSRVKGRLSRL